MVDKDHFHPCFSWVPPGWYSIEEVLHTDMGSCRSLFQAYAWDQSPEQTTLGIFIGSAVFVFLSFGRLCSADLYWVAAASFQSSRYVNLLFVGIYENLSSPKSQHPSSMCNYLLYLAFFQAEVWLWLLEPLGTTLKKFDSGGGSRKAVDGLQAILLDSLFYIRFTW